MQSTPAYLIAHRAVPVRANVAPEETWDALSGPQWSSGLAMVSVAMKVTPRGIGVDGVVLGKAVHVRDGVEMLSMYFPEPERIGDPYRMILAREHGETAIRCFGFEKSSTGPVTVAEWRDPSTGVLRIRFGKQEADAKLETCLAVAAEAMKEAPRPSAPTPTPTPRPRAEIESVPRPLPANDPLNTAITVAIVAGLLAVIPLAFLALGLLVDFNWTH